MNVGRKKDFIRFLTSAVTCGLTGSDEVKKELIKAASFIPLGGIVAPVIIGVANSIAGNLASDHYGKIVSLDYLLDWMNTDDPDQLNHDLEKLVYRAAIGAFVLVRKMYVRDIDADASFWINFNDTQKDVYLKTLAGYFKTLEKELMGEHLSLYVVAEKADLDDTQGLISLLAEKISEVFFDRLEKEEKDRFLIYFKSNMQRCLQLAIGEELKTNERAYRAYQLCIVDGMKAQNIQLLAGQQEMLTLLRNGSADLFPIEQMRQALDGQSELLLREYTSRQEEMKDLVRSVAADVRASVAITVEREGERIRTVITLESKRLMAGFDSVLGKIDLFEKSVDKNFDQLKEQIGFIQKDLDKQINARKENYEYPHFLTNVKNYGGKLLGRDNDLRMLKEKIDTSPDPVLIPGLGGLGKSTITKVFIKTFHKHYDHLAWIEVDYNAQTGSQNIRKAIIDAFVSNPSFNLPVNTLNLDFIAGASDKDRMAQIFLVLSNIPGKNLLVIDNITLHFTEFLELLPLPPDWQVLATSRQEISGFYPFKIEELSLDDAYALFDSIFSYPDKQPILDLFSLVGRNTLMVELMARTLDTNGDLSPLELFRTLDERRLDKENRNSIYEYLVSTFNLSHLLPDEKEVLKLFYYIPSAGLKITEILTWFKIADVKIFQSSLKELVKKGWIKKDDELYSVHNLIEQLIYYQLKPDLKEALPLVVYFGDLLRDTYQADKSFTLLRIVERFLKKFTNDEMELDEFAQLFHSLGNIYKDLGQLREAEEAYQRSRTILKSILIREADKRVNRLILPTFGLGLTRQLFGDHESASELFYEVIELSDQVNGDVSEGEYRAVCLSLDALSIIYLRNFDHKNSMDTHLLAITLGKKLDQSIVENIELLASVYIDGSHIYGAINDLDAASKFALHGLALMEKVYEQEQERYQIKLIDCLVICANILLDANEYDYAKRLLDRSMQLLSPLIENFPEVFVPTLTGALTTEAAYYYAMQLPQKSVDTYARGIKMLQDLQLQGKLSNQMDLAELYGLHGAALNKAGENEKALKSYTSAFQLFHQLAPQIKQYYLRWMVRNTINLANVYRYLGHFELAEKSYLAAEKQLLEVKHDQSEEIALLYNNLGILLKDQGNYEQSEQKYLASISIRESLSEKNPKVFLDVISDVYNNLGVLYILDSKDGKAEDAFLHCFKLREELCGINLAAFAPKLARIELTLASFYLTRDIKSAVGFYCKALEHFKESERYAPDAYTDQILHIIEKLYLLIQEDEVDSVSAAAYKTLISYGLKFENPSLEERLLLLHALMNLIEFYNDQKDDLNAEKYYHDAEGYAADTKPEEPAQIIELARIKSRLGFYLQGKKDFQGAVNQFIAALNHHIDIHEVQPDEAEVGSIILLHLFLAKTYGLMDNYSLLMHYLVGGGAVLYQSMPIENEELYGSYIDEICKVIQMPVEDLLEFYVFPEIKRRQGIDD